MTDEQFMDDLRKQVTMWDDGRERSKQVEIGWSEIAGCRSALAFRMRDVWPTDDPDGWRATAGTALHLWMREVRSADDPWLEFEVEVEYRGVPGHVDEWSFLRRELVDYKFPTKAVSESWRRSPEMLREKMVQLMGYGAGMLDGRLSGEGSLMCRLLVMPVDGTSDDWWTVAWPFDRDVADEYVQRMEDVGWRLDNGMAVPRDRPHGWCQQFCEFFTACRGGDDTSRQVEIEITAPDLRWAVEEYGAASVAATEANRRKAELRPVVYGLSGIVGEWKVKTGQAGDPKWVLDEQAVIEEYAARGEEPPWVEKPGSTGSLSVSRRA
jgi:hypothetical protein